jgi:lysophospholipid acyltransferase (LPLAT)-like uncharacterized protein
MNLKLLWRLAEWPIAVPVWAWSRFVLGTARVRVEGRLDDAPAIYVHWHQHLPLLMPLLGPRGCWLMMSGAPHMAPIARWAQLLGLRLVRGTSGDGGRAALARLVELVREGGSVELAVDGPAGPPFVAKPGCVDLALATGAPIVALGYRSPAAVVTPGRWDDQLMLLPFAEVTVVARPVPVREGDTRETLLARVQSALEELRVARGS